MNTIGKVGQVVRPDGHGARQWRDRHGEHLVCVRYRYDEVRALRHTTVEIVDATSPWHPPDLETVLLHIRYEETDLRARLKSHGATWDPALRRWRTTLRTARLLNLENRLDNPDPPL